jgi:Spx/MgsR family transcriptional regulator
VTIELYGIANCDTVKKARAWLDAHNLAYGFHDYKKEGADPARLGRWADKAGWALLLNTRGTTFRTLPEEDRGGIDGPKALALMAAHPSLIKRPVVEHGEGGLLVGFDPDRWSRALA